ncbi:MAG TPA: glycerol-3-phosphate responsive antiterminator [Thermotogota bacterium]|nr:glycerol-3-phosphate responsive antiterminator [Thermotogota bacterium]HPJ88002.1 glycerol-3-phosphate responsive antiterminator [Thermotogota bacterium]HPR95089.1 glycerol-3-phosphate responsive antiterminator [Thermotogota bacterium]
MKSYNFSERIAAVWNPKEEIECLREYKGNTVFLLSSDIVNIANHVRKIKKMGFNVFLDVDFCDGLGSGEYAFRYASLQGIDGIITVKPKMIDIANSYGMPNVLRSFALDSNSLSRIKDMLANTQPMFFEILPAASFRKVSQYLRVKGFDSFKMIAAGMIDSEEEINQLIDEGAVAVSTSKKELWEF